MSEQIWTACPRCGRDLTVAVDVPAIRELVIDCPHCVDLTMQVILERCQPRNPYTNTVPEDPQAWRVASVVAGRVPRAAWRHRRPP